MRVSSVVSPPQGFAIRESLSHPLCSMSIVSVMKYNYI